LNGAADGRSGTADHPKAAVVAAVALRCGVGKRQELVVGASARPVARQSQLIRLVKLHHHT
jgi:hypothetical protein